MSQLVRIHGRRHRVALNDAGVVVDAGTDPIDGLAALLNTRFPRLVYGQVANDAAVIDAGSGDWSIGMWTGSPYVITFDTPFASPPTVLLTANNNNAAPSGSSPEAYFVEQADVDESTVTVIVYDQDGTEDNDGGFNFLAIGVAA